MQENNEEKMTKEVRLKVMEALQEEAYKGIVRIDSETMKEIGVRAGDIVEIEGGRKTVGIVDRAYPTDVGESIIRMDGILRRNAKTGISEIVTVRKVDVKEAKAITIAPSQKGVMIQAHPDLFKRVLLGRALVKGDIVVLGGAKRRRKTMTESPFFDDIFSVLEENFMGSFGFGSLKFIVAEANPKQAVVITEATLIKVSQKAMDVVEERIPEVAYEDLGGLDDEIKKIREMVELPLRHPEIFERLGIEPPKGVLLHGPPGSGKTLLAKAVANETESNFILVNGPEIMNKFVGEAEKRIRDIFEEAEKAAPSIIFIDEIDAIAPKREESYSEVERRVVAQLLTAMDGLKSRGKVIIIGATNRVNAIDPALRRPGRFDREINIGVPDQKGREAILNIHTRNMPLAEDVKIKNLAKITYGFVGADLSALTKEAAMNVVRKLLPTLKLKEDSAIPLAILEKLLIADEDFKYSLKVVRPSALREVQIEKPNTTWEDVGGMDEIKQELKEAVEWPLKHPKAFERLGVRPPRGILLYGPPGTGKTLLAKAIANESDANFILVKGPELISKWVGESEKGIRKIFEKARQASPTIVFFDEMDALAGRRGLDQGTKVTDRVVNQLLTEIDGLEDLHDVIIIGATNRPDMIDPGLLRPGRIDKIIMTPVPEKKARDKIFAIHTKNMPLAKDINLGKLVDQTENYSGADIENVCREAAILALRENIHAKEVKMKHFEDALKKVRPSLDLDEVRRYKEVEELYLRDARAGKIKETDSYLG